jgi:CBS domain containing-hemolysin-like protein
MANGVLRRFGVEPTDQVGSGQNPGALLHLVEHSTNVGALDASYSTQLTGALELETLTVGDLLQPGSKPTGVPARATVSDVREASRRSGHLRVLVGDGNVRGVVHVRDTLNAPSHGPAEALMRPALTLARQTPVYAALAEMRETSSHLALVHDGADLVGVVTIADLLRRLFPRPESGGAASSHA